MKTFNQFITELSADTLKAYSKKASRQMRSNAKKTSMDNPRMAKGKAYWKAKRITQKRADGLVMAKDQLKKK